MKNVLITRQKDQAQEISRVLENKGFSVFIEPLFLLEKIDVKYERFLSENTPISAVIITSANACDAVINFDLKKDVKIFSIGKKTSQKLEEKGFKNIVFAPARNASSLRVLISETHHNKSDPILYFHGSTISLDFEQELKKFGFLVKKIPSYRTIEIENFSDDLLRFSKTKFFDQVFLFSQSSAKTFLKLAQKHNMLEYFTSATIFCLSEKILQEVKNFDQKNQFQNLQTFQ